MKEQEQVVGQDALSVASVDDEAPRPGLWTVSGVLEWSAKYLAQHGCASARLDAELLLAKSLGCDRVALYTNPEKPLKAQERESYRMLLVRRAAREPVAYLLGKKAFWKSEFDVDEFVLIPRPETEILVEEAVKILLGSEPGSKALDLGFGSGCVGISIAKENKDVVVTGWDQSPQALLVARSNAEKLQVKERCEFKLQDMLEEEAWLDQKGQYLVIVANPPYLSDEEHRSASQEVLFEPKSALTGGEDGLYFYHHLAKLAQHGLASGGVFLTEIGASQGEAVCDIFAQAGWTHISILKDLSGNDRVVRCQYEVVS